MKGLFLILSLILLTVENSNACKGLQEPELADLVEKSKQFAALLSDDLNYLKYQTISSKAQKDKNFNKAMAPIDLKADKYAKDINTIGKIVVVPNNKNEIQFEGVGYKFGNKCVLTAAHNLYPSVDQKVSEKNRELYDGSITFIRGTGKNAKKQNASVFFKMTTSDDYIVEGEERKFKGYSDFVILKLAEGDDSKREIKVTSPSELLKGVDSRLGKRVDCMGLPSHMTEKKYGNCQGSDFFWEQKNARIFAEDESRYEFGIVTNGAFTKGMSGGGCTLSDSQNKELIGIAVNGYDVDENNAESMPDIEFVNRQYKLKNARHIATFHELDRRMKNELGVGLDKIDEVCK